MEKSVNTVLSIGMFDKDTHKQELKTEDIFATIVNNMPDCQIIKGYGKYTHDNGHVVIEPCFIVTCYGVTFEDVMPAVERLKNLLNQESIAMTKQVQEVVFA